MLSRDQQLAIRNRAAEIAKLLDEALDAAILSSDEEKLAEVERLLAGQIEAIRSARFRRPSSASACDDRR